MALYKSKRFLKAHLRKDLNVYKEPFICMDNLERVFNLYRTSQKTSKRPRGGILFLEDIEISSMFILCFEGILCLEDLQKKSKDLLQKTRRSPLAEKKVFKTRQNFLEMMRRSLPEEQKISSIFSMFKEKFSS